MNIIVAIKQVPDLDYIRIRDRRPIMEDVPQVIGDIDKSALAAAVDLKESAGGNVIIVSAGDENLEDTIKEGLAAGADEAVLVKDARLAGMESSVIGTVLAATISKIENGGLIIFGEGSADNYSGQVVSRVAQILGYPQVGYVNWIEIEERVAQATRSLENEEETVEIPLPAVMSVVSEIKEPKIPSVSSILKARNKPKRVYTLDDLGIEIPENRYVRTVINLAPVSQRKGILIKSVDELVKVFESEGIIRR
ncbi:MAG TPA: electron transfer flavoprotein beta subunit/FixA family protein [Deltaproteobacteria bacterium]|nr:electron transfer flavoprotein beta subunit/FixA family protein [Deltaproteobacteria bacterium]